MEVSPKHTGQTVLQEEEEGQVVFVATEHFLAMKPRTGSNSSGERQENTLTRKSKSRASSFSFV